jgi:signal transduction histidine kinase
VIILARGEITKYGVSVQTRLAEGLLSVHGDRVQLQQVVLNLILNSVEAMDFVKAGKRQLLINTEQDRSGSVLWQYAIPDQELIRKTMRAFSTHSTPPKRAALEWA